MGLKFFIIFFFFLLFLTCISKLALYFLSINVYAHIHLFLNVNYGYMHTFRIRKSKLYYILEFYLLWKHIYFKSLLIICIINDIILFDI